MKNERLIRARIQCGYTQSEIAARAKISLRAYQNYESGRRCPNVSVARLMIRYNKLRKLKEAKK